MNEFEGSGIFFLGSMVGFFLCVFVLGYRYETITILDHSNMRYELCLENASKSKDYTVKQKADNAEYCSNMYEPIIDFLEKEKETRKEFDIDEK